MSTRNEDGRRAAGGPWPASGAAGRPRDPAEEVAAIAAARREQLIRAHRFRLRREDLEDCYGQATLELMLRARRGASFLGRAHIANALELRFLSRIQDRRRALAGRSAIQAALEGATALGAGGDDRFGIVDLRSEPERMFLLRQELRRVEAAAGRLSEDQRLVLACQVGLEMGRAEFCSRFGWSPEKYRKVAQRARARLRHLMAVEERDVLPRGGPSD